MLAVLFLTTGYSLYGTLTAPGNMSTEARIAEWARAHWMGWAVTWLENQQYQADKPKTGGTLTPQQLAELSPPTVSAPPLAKDEHVLPPMKPFVPNPAPGEGDWRPTVVVNGIPIVQTAQLRSDPDHLQYLSAVAWMDQKHANFVLHPGSQQPGTDGYNQTDHLSGDQLKNLIATWNGAFLLKPNDAHGGFFLNGKTFGTLADGQASEVFYKNGTMNVGTWNSGPDFTLNPNVVGVRQNLKLLVDNGQINPSVDSDDKNLWGVTVKNAYFVWRSGIGVTADGNVVYAMGPALSVRTLAELLQRAGAVRAMELDINQQWVSYMTYDGSKDPMNPASTKLLDFARTERRYFSTEERDFVAVYSH
ncbi:phosphodiester glycosidase family protein [Catenulispora yoronensis]